jgi:hypothetical protein
MSPKLLSVSLAFAVAIASAAPAAALTMKECSTKYKAAQKAGTLQGMKWTDFRKAECGPNAKPAAATAAPAPAPSGKSARTSGTKRSTATPTSPTVRPSAGVFPRAVDPKYSKESPGKARMKTCVDQYNANKAKNANGGLKWIQKGGGYWSECNKHLKS